MDIRCRKTTCKFNNFNTCMAKSIVINNDVNCSSYEISKDLLEKNTLDEDDLLKTEDKSKKLFRKTPKIAPFRNRKKLEIHCKADCLFNVNGICKANGITINDLDYPICMGYLPK